MKKMCRIVYQDQMIAINKYNLKVYKHLKIQ